MFRAVSRTLLTALLYAAVITGATECLWAATEVQNFDIESDAINAGWVGVDNRNVNFGNDFGFSDTNEAGGVSGAGEAGGFFPRRTTPWGYYGDISVGNLTLNDAMSATGRIVFDQQTLDGGIALGWFKHDDRDNRVRAFVGVGIAEGNRHQAAILLNDGSGSDAVLTSGGIGPVSTPFSLNWDPTTRLVTTTIGGVTTTTTALTDAQMAVGSDLNAFGLLNGSVGANPNSLSRGRLFIDDLAYTSGDTTTLQLRINRFTGATRIFGSGGTAPVELDGYTASSNLDNPPLENVWLPGNWNSITDQDGGGWSEITSPTVPDTQQLSEANLSGSKTLGPGSSIQLGNVYDTTTFSDDISFSYGFAGESFVRPGHVVFEGGLRLRVDKESGNVKIVNPELLNIDIDGYVIQSASGVLTTGGWNSLEQQALAGWEEIASSSSTDLSEINFTSSSVVNANGGLFDLGDVYTGGLAGAEDLRFTFSLAGGTHVIEGVIQYLTGDLVGDYNSDGIVDAADYTIWRDTLNSTIDLRADGNGNSVVDAGDYQVWKDNYGQSSGSGGIGELASVPEPATCVMALFAAAAVWLMLSALDRVRTLR